MDVKRIIKEWLIAHGYDGLVNDERCGCGIDSLGECGENCMDCMPAHRVNCQTCPHKDTGECDCVDREWDTEEFYVTECKGFRQ